MTGWSFADTPRRGADFSNSVPRLAREQRPRVYRGRVGRNSAQKRISMTSAIPSLTAKSPIAQVTHGRPLPQKAILKNMTVSNSDATLDETNGAYHQRRSLNRPNTKMSVNCAARKVRPEATAIRGVARYHDNPTANTKPA